MDEILGRKFAVQQGVAVKGTLGVLEEAATKHLIDLPEAIHRLRQTNIYLADAVVQGVLDRHQQRQRALEAKGVTPMDPNLSTKEPGKSGKDRER